MLNCFLQIRKFVLMRNLEQLWVILCEVQSQLEIFLLYILGQSKILLLLRKVAGEILLALCVPAG